MKYSETVANDCRYGSIAAPLFEGCEIVLDDSEADYQGQAKVVGKRPDGSYIFYEWSYGSCSGCDDWENRSLSDAQIFEEMKADSVVLTEEGLRMISQNWQKKPSI